MKYTELLGKLNAIAPQSLSEAWDCDGIQVHTGKEDVHRVLVCLDVTKEVINEAKHLKADFIVSHHPMFFGGLKNIDADSIEGQCAVELIKAGISVYSLHTCFDKADGGNNDYICKLLGLVNCSKLKSGDNESNYIGRIGEFSEEITLKTAASNVVNAFNLDYSELKIVGDLKTKIKKVAVCSGAGADLLGNAIAAGCDLFITGDVKYHDGQTAKAKGMALIDAGHFGTEYLFIENMTDLLTKEVRGQVEVLASQININPFVFLENKE